MGLNHSEIVNAGERLSHCGEQFDIAQDAFFAQLRKIRVQIGRFGDTVRKAVDDRGQGTTSAIMEADVITHLLRDLVREGEKLGTSYAAEIAMHAGAALGRHGTILQHGREADSDGSGFLTALAEGFGKVAALPLSRLVACAQARDSLDQRLDHVKTGLVMLSDAPSEELYRASAILAAQIESIADTLDEVSESALKSADALTNGMESVTDTLCSEGIGRVRGWSNELQQMSADLLTDPELSEEIKGAAKKLHEAAREMVSDSAPDPVAEEVQKTLRPLLGEISDMRGEISDLVDLAPAFREIAVSLRHAMKGTHDSTSSQTVLSALQDLYTSEIEHDIHRNEVLKAKQG